MKLHLVGEEPEGLTRRARSFVGGHCIRVDPVQVEAHRQRWLEVGVPGEEIDRVVAYQQRWGGLVLPPYPRYNGGPKYLQPDVPWGSVAEGWWFEAGPQRFSVPYSFVIGPGGEFGMYGDRWSPLHESVEGWVESLALAYHASLWAKQITRLRGDEVDDLDLGGYEPVPEVRGLADTWWRGADSLVAVYTGEVECLSFPAGRAASIYSGLDEWGLYG